MKNTKLSWEDIEKITSELAEKIKASKFTADYIIGITTGGLIPLYFLSKKLNLTEKILTLSATSYDKDVKRELKIVYLPKVDLAGKKVLLVDDIADTGDTLDKVSNIIQKEYNVSELKTATLAANLDHCKFFPDFYVTEEKGGWLVFPWEKEDFPEYFK